MTVEHRSALPAGISYEGLVHALITGKAESAISQLRALREKQPNHDLLQEENLGRLIVSLSDTWGLTKEATPVIRFVVELYPDSARALWMLAENHIDMHDYPSAISVYNRLLEQDPDDNLGYIKPRLGWLHSQK